MMRDEIQKGCQLNEQTMLHRQIVWLSGMLTLSRNTLSNFRNNQHAAFQNGLECLRLMSVDVYLNDEQRGTLAPILDLAKRKPEALRGIGAVIRQFLRPLTRQVMSNGSTFR